MALGDAQAKQAADANRNRNPGSMGSTNPARPSKRKATPVMLRSTVFNNVLTLRFLVIIEYAKSIPTHERLVSS